MEAQVMVCECEAGDVRGGGKMFVDATSEVCQTATHIPYGNIGDS